MIVKLPEQAQVQIILVTDNALQTQDIIDNLAQSKVDYFLVCVARKADFLFHFYRNFVDLLKEIPTVFLFDYKFSEGQIEQICLGMNIIAQAIPVEYLLINAPLDMGLREKLGRTGASFYDGEYEDRKMKINYH
jgi:hypothetical protein